jgi:hypothetical protein
MATKLLDAIRALPPRRRRLLAAGLAVVVLLTGAAVGVAALLDAERVGRFAAARAAAALDRDVRVDGFRVRVFPRVAVVLEGVEIGGPRGEPGAPAVATARRVELRPRLLPLLRREVVVDALVVDRPRILIRIAADGTSNLPAFGGDEGDAAAGTPGDVALDLRSFRVRDGRVAYLDEGSGVAVRLDGMEQRLRLAGAVAAGELARVALAGEIAVAALDAELPGSLAWPVRGLKLRLEHEAELDRAADRLELTRLRLTLQEVPLELAGMVTALSDSTARTVALRVETGAIDVARLVASLPRGLVEADGEALRGVGGRASLSARVVGRAGGGAVPAVAGTLRLDDVALARGGRGARLAEGVAGDVAFTLDSVTSAGITGRLLGEPARVAFTVRDFAAPQGRLEVRAALELEALRRAGLLPAEFDGAGRIALDVAAAGALLAPEAADLTGTIGVTGLSLATSGAAPRLLVSDGVVELGGRTLAARGVRAQVGGSDLTLDVEAREWLPYALGDTARAREVEVVFEARSDRFDADEAFGTAPDHTYSELFFARLQDRPLAGRTAAEHAEAAGLGLPEIPPIRLDGRVRAARLVNGGTAFDDVDVAVAAREGQLHIRAASFRLMGGGVHLAGQFGRAAGGAGEGASQPLELTYSVRDVSAGPFLERFATFRDHIDGGLLLGGSVRMELDRHLLPVRETVTGEGTIAIVGGRLVNWPLVRALAERTGVARFDTLAFRDWTGRYRFAGAAVLLEESLLEMGDMAVRAAGTFDLNGNLELGATVHLPPAWTARIPGAPPAFRLAADAAAGPDGRVPVGARIAGTAASPTVRLDLSEAGGRVAERAREAAEAEARARMVAAEAVARERLNEAEAEARARLEQAVRGAAAGAAGNLPGALPGALPGGGRDSLALRADSLRQRVESEATGRLRQVVRPRAAPVPPPPTQQPPAPPEQAPPPPEPPSPP